MSSPVISPRTLIPSTPPSGRQGQTFTLGDSYAMTLLGQGESQSHNHSSPITNTPLTPSFAISPNANLPIRSSPLPPAYPQIHPLSIIRPSSLLPTSYPYQNAPLFAEQFASSPSALRSRRAQAIQHQLLSTPKLPPGRSKVGYFDPQDGDLFRGAEKHPGMNDGMSRRPPGVGGGVGHIGVDFGAAEVASMVESAATGSSSSSSSSSWSGLSLGRRMTIAMDRVGDALGVRRGSIGGDTASVTESTVSGVTGTAASNQRRGRRRSSKGKRTRAMTFGTRSKRSESMEGGSTNGGGQKRQHIPTRREFCLVLPSDSPAAGGALGGGNDTGDIGLGGDSDMMMDPPSPTDMGGGGVLGGKEERSLVGRMTTTPDLGSVLEMIRLERLRTGYRFGQNQSGVNTPAAVEERHGKGKENNRRLSFTSGLNQANASKGKNAHTPRVDELRKDAGYFDRTVPFSSSGQDTPHRAASNVDLSSLDTSNSSTPTSDLLIRPKSASDLLGLPPQHHHHSSHRSHQPHRHKPKRQQTFVLPPRPALGRGLSAMLDPVMEEEMKSKVRGRAAEVKKPCWWLDVSCPGWQDLRDLGELLGLHPLTLEDVLQQDPREKMDVFEQLGYHLIVFRAIDETYFKYTAPDLNTDLSAKQQGSGIDLYKRKKTNGFLGLGLGGGKGKTGRGKGERGILEIVEDNPGMEGLEGIGAGGINIYLVVFEDGIVSFHFNDISKHTDRVRERMLQFAEHITTADWVAHGLMDSVVDAFFPLVRHIDEEVDDIDTLVIDPTRKPKAKEPPATSLDSSALSALQNEIDKEDSIREKSSSLDDEKRGYDGSASSEKRSFTPWISKGTLVKRKSQTNALKIAHYRIHAWFVGLQMLWYSRWIEYKQTPSYRSLRARWLVVCGFLGFRKNKHYRHLSATREMFDRTTMLRRMVQVRRLTSGLSRLLGSKQQVVRQLKKRAGNQRGEVWAYIGDVQDHILMLETSLRHFDYILSHCQPAYMSHINVSYGYQRGRTDQFLVVLTGITIGTLPIAVMVGMLSINANQIPQNGAVGMPYHEEADGSQSPFNYFIAVCCLAIMLAVGFFLLIRYWRWKARKDRENGRSLIAKRDSAKGNTLWKALRRQLQSSE